MGSDGDMPVLLECILMLDGRLMGESAVVSRRFRSELRDEDESVRGGGRAGSVYREDEACGGSGGRGALIAAAVAVAVRG